MSVTVDSLRALDGTVSTLQHQTDYFKHIDGVMKVVKRMVCLDACMYCERSDCSIYVLKNGELILCDFIQGAE